jgi:hypothetical protein
VHLCFGGIDVASFYGFDIWLWNCSNSVACFFSFIGNCICFFFYWKLNSFLLLLETEFVSSFIGNWICFFFYWKLNSLLLLLETEFVSSFIGNCITFYLYRTLATFVVLWNIICTFSKYCRLSFSLVYSYLNRLEEGFCVFRNGLISILDWVFDNVWSCSTLFIMKTSHKSDELKKKGGGHKSGTYGLTEFKVKFKHSFSNEHFAIYKD